jgi:hypothetical protein
MQVTATQLVQWAETKDAQGALPRLVRRLCFKADSTRQLAFPAGDSTYSPGWDGVLVCETGDAWRPAGRSCWEMSCNKNPATNANGYYEKRTKTTPKSSDAPRPSCL